MKSGTRWPSEALTPVTGTRTASCLFCGRTAPLRSISTSVQLDCEECGPYELTLGVISRFRLDWAVKEIVKAEIRRQLRNGVAMPLIDLEVLKSLTGR
jgi:hypothetical protein